MFCCVSAAEG